MSITDQEKFFLSKTKALLDESMLHLHPHVLVRLNGARRAALAGRKRTASMVIRMPRWALASGFATVAVALLVGGLWLSTPDNKGVTASGVEDAEILATGEGLEFYEDLDFYQWLAKTADSNG